jgi:hypothetical protein
MVTSNVRFGIRRAAVRRHGKRHSVRYATAASCSCSNSGSSASRTCLSPPLPTWSDNSVLPPRPPWSASAAASPAGSRRNCESLTVVATCSSPLPTISAQPAPEYLRRTTRHAPCRVQHACNTRTICVQHACNMPCGRARYHVAHKGPLATIGTQRVHTIMIMPDAAGAAELQPQHSRMQPQHSRMQRQHNRMQRQTVHV